MEQSLVGRIIIKAMSLGWLNWMSDSSYLKIMYRIQMGEKLNLKNPKTYNEKLQWLKIHNRKPVYTVMVDKYAAKDFIAEKIGRQYVVPTLGVWEKFEEIDFDALPAQFVLKCTHDSGGLVVVKNKSQLDKVAANNKIKRSLHNNYYYWTREWPYKNVPARIIAEPYLKDDALQPNAEQECLTDYKLFCFNGEPKIMYISKDKAENPTTDFFDMDFNHLNLRMKDPNSEKLPKKPEKFEEMKEIARKLSKDIPHLRVDFYCADNTLYVGEMTFYHCAGMAHIMPKIWEEKMGEWIEL